MREHVFSVILLFFVFSISAQDILEKNYNTFQEFLNEQNQNISKIANGINQSEVQIIMGKSVIVKVPKIDKMPALKQLFKQPHYTNIYKSNPQKEIKVLWYFSTPKDQNGLISKSECAPVILENDAVIGVGWEFFNQYRRSNALR